MLTLRAADTRGPTRTDWLHSLHSFSFGHYHDPEHMGYGPLRVINEDVVAPGKGFAMHPHNNMEILTWVISGAVAHTDSMGNEARVTPGEAQLMSAGTGIRHSEYNPSDDTPLHLLQIWILPRETGTMPGYQQRDVLAGELDGRLALIVSPDGRDGSLTIRQDADIYATRLKTGQSVGFTPRKGRRYWLQLATGALRVNGRMLSAGDGLAIEGEDHISITAADAADHAEALFFDLP